MEELALWDWIHQEGRHAMIVKERREHIFGVPNDVDHLQTSQNILKALSVLAIRTNISTFSVLTVVLSLSTAKRQKVQNTCITTLCKIVYNFTCKISPEWLQLNHFLRSSWLKTHEIMCALCIYSVNFGPLI